MLTFATSALFAQKNAAPYSSGLKVSLNMMEASILD